MTGDIRFWIVLFFVLRLYGITNPPLEVAHNWRQTTVTMVARNFYEADPSILYPRIDIAGEKSGITGMEFPFLNYLIYLTSLIFGYAHWYGRLINLIISSIGLMYFYKLILKYFDLKTAFNATFILLFSVWFNYSRKVMPDTFSMSFVLAGIYYGSNYFDVKSNLKNLFLFFVLTLAGVLSKLPSAYLLVLFMFFIVNKKFEIRPKLIFFLAGSTCMSIVALYYFYWVPYLTSTFGFQHFFMGKSIQTGFIETMQHLSEASEKFYLEALQIVGFLVFIIGVIMAIINKNKQVLWIFGLCFAGFLVIIFKAGFVFYHHSYYIIPFAPVMALVAAYALGEIKNKKWTLVVLWLIASENLLNKFNDYHIKPDNLEILNLERDLGTCTNKNDLILINSKNVPSPMYFAHHKGWVNSNEMISQTEYIQSLKSKGLKYIVILKKTFGADMNLDYPIVFDCKDYKIYKL